MYKISKTLSTLGHEQEANNPGGINVNIDDREGEVIIEICNPKALDNHQFLAWIIC